jgi:hypothetical protein
MAHAHDQHAGLEPQSIAYDHWEFFCSPEATEANPRGWGWRGRLGSEVVFESQHFSSFMACYRDARANGFVGDIDFAASITAPESPHAL